MNLSNWFRALELKATANKTEIKSAYYRLCQIHHPDKTNNCPTAVQRFRAINEAYEQLMKAPIKTSNIQHRPEYSEPKSGYTRSKAKYAQQKTWWTEADYIIFNKKYTAFKGRYTPPKSEANNTKSKCTNEQSSNTKSKASSKQGKLEST